MFLHSVEHYKDLAQWAGPQHQLPLQAWRLPATKPTAETTGVRRARICAGQGCASSFVAVDKRAARQAVGNTAWRRHQTDELL